MKSFRLYLIAFTLILRAAAVQGQQGEQPETVRPDSQAVYYLTNMVDTKNNRMEAWKIEQTNDEESIIIKKSFRGAFVQTTRTDKVWWNEIYTEGAATYIHEGYATYPFDLDPGERSYGYMEERSVQDDSVIESWPIFFEVEGSGTARRLTMHGFLSGNLQLVIVRDYQTEGSYLLPLRESQLILQGSQIVSYVIYARMR